jgi:hypothetical protein
VFKANNAIKAGVAATALTALILGGAGAAMADPSGVTAGTPASPSRLYVAVGSDTIQDVWNGLSNGTAGINGGAAVIPSVASYDAFGTSTIQTRTSGPTFTRPGGSGNGSKALSAAWDSSNHVWSGSTLSSSDVSFSRSSSAPGSAVAVPAGNVNDKLTYLPFARDAVSVAYTKATAGATTPNFTVAQLKSIYGGPGVTGGSATVTYDSTSAPTQVFVNGTRVFPYIPQSGSGTRQFFLGALGLGSTFTAFPAYVDQVSDVPAHSGVTQENDGAEIAGTTAALIPFSAAQWIAQSNGAVTTTITSTEDIATIGGVDPLASRTTTPLAAGNLFGAPDDLPSGLARDTYNVIPTSEVSSNSALYQVLSGSASGTAKLGTSDANAVLAKFGFRPIDYLGDSSQYLHSTFQH